MDDGEIVYTYAPIVDAFGQMQTDTVRRVEDGAFVPVERLSAAARDAVITPAAVAAGAFIAAKKAKAAEIAGAFAAALAKGLAFGGVLYQIDERSQQRIAARSLLALACMTGADTWPENFGWIAADNSRPTFATAETFWTFAAAAHARVTALTLNARALKDKLIAAADIGAVEAIDATTGWESLP